MTLQFQPPPLEAWLRQQQLNQRPDPSTITQPLMEGLQTFLDQKNKDEMMKLAQAKEGREQLQSQSEYGTPIDPNVMTSNPQGNAARSMFMPTGQGQVASGMPLVEAFNKWRTGGMSKANAQPEFMGALGKDERKSFFDQNSPEKQAEANLKNAQADFYKRRPSESAGSSGSFMMGGVGENGEPVFYNNKTLETRTAPVPGGGLLYPKTPSEGQMNASLFGQRAHESNQQIEQLLNEGFDPTTITSGAATHLPNIMQPEKVQAYEQAKRNFRNAVLRKESGAAISPSEHAEAEKQYFPVAGDSPETLAFKTRNRQTAIQGLNRMAGPMTAQGSNSRAGTKIGRFTVVSH